MSRAAGRDAALRLGPTGWSTTAAFLAMPLALAPLVGWAAAWPALAGYATGWLPVPPATALALLAAAVALALLAEDGGLAPWRRVAGGVLGAGITLVGLAALLQEPAARLHETTEIVRRWHAEPSLLRGASMSMSGAAAVCFLGVALALLAAARNGATRGAQLAATGAVLVALLGAAPPDVAAAEGVGMLVVPRAATMSPPVALLVLLLASGVLLARGGLAAWGVPPRGPAAVAARLITPSLLLVPATLVWLTELAERRRLVSGGEARTLLLLGLVVLLGLALAHLAMRLHEIQDEGLARERQRAQRHVRREAEQVALQAEHVTRFALDRYRSNLRGILELAPAAFVVLDAVGAVVYANAAAASLFGRPPHLVAGFPLEHAWPELGAAVQRALDAHPMAAGDERIVTDPRTGRSVEVRGFPGEEGVALFLRVVE